MLTLVIDTSTPAVTVAIADAANDRLMSEKVLVDARAHAEQLTPLIVSALEESDVHATQLSAIIAGVGPGPFTGLRVGLVTAAAMGHALDIATYGVCSLDAIAYSCEKDGEPFLVATDARRKEIYWATYDSAGNRLSGPNVDKPGALPAETKIATRAVGDGAAKYAELLEMPTNSQPQFPNAAGLLSVASGLVRAAEPSQNLTPLYLRRPDVHGGGQPQADRRLDAQS